MADTFGVILSHLKIWHGTWRFLFFYELCITLYSVCCTALLVNNLNICRNASLCTLKELEEDAWRSRLGQSFTLR